MPTDPTTDRACLLALQQGEAAALNRLIARWERPLHGFAYRYVQNYADAQDLVAEAFVRLYRQRQRLRTDTKLSAWLFTTLANLCHNCGACLHACQYAPPHEFAVNVPFSVHCENTLRFQSSLRQKPWTPTGDESV